jgi:hypothetical protein
VQGYGFFNVGVQLVNRFSLREDVFANASGAPELAIVINFYLYEHGRSLIEEMLSRSSAICYLKALFIAFEPNQWSSKSAS